MNNMNLSKIIEEMKLTVYLFVLAATIFLMLMILGFGAYELYISL
jgi:hypothetical protein